MYNKQCIIIFPVYESLSSSDKQCFEQALRMTKGFKAVFVAANSFNFDKSYDQLLINIDVVRFDDVYFESIQGYNRLMLSPVFYDRFSDFDYMLIHQADAYLFKPELVYWCNQGYSYIGAPWFQTKLPLRTRIEMLKIKRFPFLYSETERIQKRELLLLNEVGNGGLSLRQIKIFREVLAKAPDDLLKKYEENNIANFNEDVFWSIEAMRIVKNFIKPSCRKALKFSCEHSAEVAYNLNKSLPFGCHAFDKINTEFWKQFIPFLND